MEAVRLQIPPIHQGGIAKIVALEEASFQELLSVLNNVPLTYNVEPLKKQIIPKLVNVSRDVASDIIDTLYVMNFIQLEMDLTITDFIDRVYQTMLGMNEVDIDSDIQNSELFKGRLISLMNARLIRIATKARNVLFEQEHILNRTRILTDIRSVFGDDVGENPVGAIIVHMLRIHYTEGQESKDFFVALDTSDVSILINLLTRAQEKAETLKAVLQSAQIHYIDAE